MSSQPIFSNRFIEFSKQYGKLFQPDDSVWSFYLEPSIRACESNWQPARGFKNASGDSFDFELGYIECKDIPNALCGYNQGLHILLMYHTFPISLLELFNTLLCHEEILSDVGDPKAEKNHYVHNLTSPPGFAVFTGEVHINHIDDVIRIFGPNCPHRRSTAFALFQSCLNLVWEHEMAHAVNGHVLYLQRELGFETIDALEFRSLDEHTNKKRIYTYMEMSADKGACFSNIVGPILKYSLQPFSMISSNDINLIKSVELKMLAGAFFSIFMMLTDAFIAHGDVQASEIWDDHPSSLARALHFVLEPISQANLNIPLEVSYIVKHAAEEAAKELIQIGNHWGLFRPFRWLAYNNMYDTVFSQHELPEDERRKLQDCLERYRYSHRQPSV